jgi:FAD/FMN-containing dehydrogenase
MLNPVTDAVRARLAEALPGAALRPVEPRYLEEPRGSWTGQAAAVVAPGSAEEVAAVLRIAGAERVPVLPYGGGTGLVGGQVMTDGPAPLLLSLERMARIRSVHPAEGVLVAEAGAVLATVQAAAAEAGRLFPLSLGSEGTARIGGLLGTNAGGVNVLRYGNARELCLGVEAVLPDGSILHGLKRLRKDNTGYDLRPADRVRGHAGRHHRGGAAAFPAPGGGGGADGGGQPRRGAGAAGADAGAGGLGRVGLRADLGHRAGVSGRDRLRAPRPFDEIPGWMVLIDLGLSEGGAPEALLEAVFAEGHEAGLVSDGVIAQSEAQRQAFWTLRETIPLANRRIGAISLAAAELGQVDDEGAADDLAAEPLDQLDPGLGRAAGGQQVVDHQHRLAGLDRVVVDLDDRLAVFERVFLAMVCRAACPSCGSARSRWRAGARWRRRG